MKTILWNIILTFCFITMVEGIASFKFAFFESTPSSAISTIPLKERAHTDYDSLLGWKSSPSVSIPDLYGPGTKLTTNSSGFRGGFPTPTRKPKGTRRAICSGDSFTLGFRVSDHETWCHILSGLIPHLDTVNMGQGGYGIDQSYLWYKEDGLKLEHDIHIFAFIADDFARLRISDFFGVHKPYFRMKNGKPELQNVPVPLAGGAPKETIADLARNLRSLQWFLPKKQRIIDFHTIIPGFSGEESLNIAISLFRELQIEDNKIGRKLLLVYLPSGDDFLYSSVQDQRRELKRRIGDAEIPYVDLVDGMAKLPEAKLYELYFLKGPEKRPENLDHYNLRGNLWVANQIKGSVQALLSESRGHVPLTPKEKLANSFKTDRGIHGVR